MAQALIVYTTEYRKGGAQFARVASTMAEELSAHAEVRCEAIESKRDLKAIFHDVKTKGQTINEFHFVGHSGMYGPMYGTVEYPEQFSPFEWKQLDIPFANGAKAYFHCCRSARWFANFFANAFGIETLGYHWYTTFSARKQRFKLDLKGDGPLYSIGCIGRKSHGWSGSIRKYLGAKAEDMKSFLPSKGAEDTTYDEVAELYNSVFQDIKVREDEWNWIAEHLEGSENLDVLDIGCGNGALLKELAPRVKSGMGLDLSDNILKTARQMNQGSAHLEFRKVNGPKLPVDDNSVDVVISMLSFRYLDWDPLMEEVRRVLRPGGKMIILDMVAVPVKWREIPFFLRCKWKHYQHRRKYPAYNEALQKLVKHPAWKTMLKYNPIRSEHEMKWYLESRFPGQKMDKINVGYHSSIVAFDTGDFDNIEALKLSYP